MSSSLIRIAIEIEGTTPLLMNRFTDEAQQKATSGTGSSLIGDRGTAREQAEKKLYTHEGEIGIPQPNLFRCFIDAGKFFKNGRSKITTQKTSLIPACVEIEGMFLPLKTSEDWQVDTRPVRIPATGGRILAHRPMFEKWGLAFETEVDTSMISVKLFRELVDAAGKRIGLGDFRPDTKGPFGKFVVVEWDRQ
ncbi:MAG: hypothetical protein V3U46_04065 [Acidimicrobiia bacterium]